MFCRGLRRLAGAGVVVAVSVVAASPAASAAAIAPGPATGAGWRRSHDPDLDFAFLSVAASGGRLIQRVTGGLQLGINRGYTHPIRVIGYNDSADKPVGCATRSFRFAADQMGFYCGGYRDGTSGAPWVLGYDGSKGTGMVFGVIGGYEWGGDYDWASYSAVLGSSALQLFRQAEATAAARAG